MAQFLKHIACPRCGSSDANAVYDDGSSFCFSCRKPKGSTISPLVLPKQALDAITLPSDVSTEYNKDAVEWLTKYITIEEALTNNILYSKQRNQVIFSWYSPDGSVLAYQARNLSATSKAKKYFTQGDINGILPIYYADRSGSINASFSNPTDVSSLRSTSERGRRLVLVEDCLSAIKITALGFDAMPCLGSGIPLKKIARLRPFYDFLDVFLDPDMWHKSLLIAGQARRLGMQARSINSDKDPKEHTYEELKKLLK